MGLLVFFCYSSCLDYFWMGLGNLGIQGCITNVVYTTYFLNQFHYGSVFEPTDLGSCCSYCLPPLVIQSVPPLARLSVKTLSALMFVSILQALVCPSLIYNLFSPFGLQVCLLMFRFFDISHSVACFLLLVLETWPTWGIFKPKFVP